MSNNLSSGKIVRKPLSYDDKYRRKKLALEVEDLKDEGYHIGKVLGEGSYCKVKLARYKEKDLAVKIITLDTLSVDFKTKFLPRELQMLDEMKHPNIVNVHRIFKYPLRVYIFMDLIRRGDLLGFVRSRGKLLEREACQYFQQMISALQYLHGQNIAHQNLKCENIMITDSNQVKLIDFGFCRRTRDETGRRVLSRTFCGSTAYAAPEVLQAVPYNPMMYDVWSLGCVLFIMVTGTMPFNDSNVQQMVSHQLNRQYHYPRSFFLSKQVKSVISRMLEPDVTKRATVNHISRSSWIIRNQARLNTAKSLGSGKPREHPATLYKNQDGSRSIGTQTKDTYVPNEFDVTQCIPNIQKRY